MRRSGAAEGLTSATNVAIKPGTTAAYMTVSGPDGGFVYSFEALGNGSASPTATASPGTEAVVSPAFSRCAL